MRPLGVQVLALAYRTGEAWNETAYSNPEFDAKLKQAMSISDPAKRREAMKDIETILQDSGVIVQPFWQKLYCHMSNKGKRLRHAPDVPDRAPESLAGRGLIGASI
jgi:peptide/nickel transport system substrate-binding protein